MRAGSRNRPVIKVNKAASKVLVTPIRSDRCRRGPVTRKTLPGARSVLRRQWNIESGDPAGEGACSRFSGAGHSAAIHSTDNQVIHGISPRPSRSTVSWSTRPCSQGACRDSRPIWRPRLRSARASSAGPRSGRTCRSAASRQLDPESPGTREPAGSPRCVKPDGPAPCQVPCPRRPSDGVPGQSETQTAHSRRPVS